MGLADFASRIGGVLSDPRDTFRRVAAGEGSGLEAVFLTFSFPALLGALTGSIIIGHAGGGAVLVLLTALGGAVVAAVAWVLLAGIAHLFAKYVFKGNGRFDSLLKLYGYSSSPLFLVLAGVLLASVWPAWLSLVTLTLTAIALTWVVVLYVVAVEENYGISVGRALMSSIAAPLLLSVLLTYAILVATGAIRL